MNKLAEILKGITVIEYIVFAAILACVIGIGIPLAADRIETVAEYWFGR